MSLAKEALDTLESVLPKNEAVDAKQVIQDLINTESSDDNQEQGKLAQLVKGLAFSEDPRSDAFMKRLTDMIDMDNFGDLLDDEDSE